MDTGITWLLAAFKMRPRVSNQSASAETEARADSVADTVSRDELLLISAMSSAN